MVHAWWCIVTLRGTISSSVTAPLRARSYMRLPSRLIAEKIGGRCWMSPWLGLGLGLRSRLGLGLGLALGQGLAGLGSGFR